MPRSAMIELRSPKPQAQLLPPNSSTFAGAFGRHQQKNGPHKRRKPPFFCGPRTYDSLLKSPVFIRTYSVIPVAVPNVFYCIAEKI